MASRYWVGPDGNTWNDTASWSASSGGASGASIPNASDNAFFDANSGSGAADVNPPTTAECLNLDFTGFTGTFNLLGNLFIGGAILDVNGSFTLGASMTFGSYLGTIHFLATASKTFTSNGIVVTTVGGLGPSLGLIFNATGGTYTFQDNFSSLYASMTLERGTLDFNGKNITVNNFSTDVLSGGATLTGGTGTLTAESIDFADSGIVLTASTSNLNIIIQNGASTNLGFFAIRDQNYTFKSLEGGHLGTPSVEFFSNGFTCTVTNFILDPISGNSDGIYFFDDPSFFTATGTFTANGSLGNLIYIMNGNDPGVQFTITAAATSISYVNVTDSVAAGAATPFDDTVGGVDGGNNVNWLFTAGAAFTPIVMLL